MPVNPFFIQIIGWFCLPFLILYLLRGWLTSGNKKEQNHIEAYWWAAGICFCWDLPIFKLPIAIRLFWAIDYRWHRNSGWKRVASLVIHRSLLLTTLILDSPYKYLCNGGLTESLINLSLEAIAIISFIFSFIVTIIAWKQPNLLEKKKFYHFAFFLSTLGAIWWGGPPTWQLIIIFVLIRLLDDLRTIVNQYRTITQTSTKLRRKHPLKKKTSEKRKRRAKPKAKPKAKAKSKKARKIKKDEISELMKPPYIKEFTATDEESKNAIRKVYKIQWPPEK